MQRRGIHRRQGIDRGEQQHTGNQADQACIHLGFDSVGTINTRPVVFV
jgi:hypothetical protein